MKYRLSSLLKVKTTKLRRNDKTHLTPTTWAKTSDRSISPNLIVPQSVYNARFIDIVRAHFHFYHVARGNFNEVFSQLPRDVRKHLVTVCKFNPEHSARENRRDLTFNFNYFVIRHKGNSIESSSFVLVSFCEKEGCRKLYRYLRVKV